MSTGSSTVTYSRADLATVALIGALVAAWLAAAAGAFSLRALLACEAIFFAFYLVGSLTASWRALAEGVLFDLPLRLLCGYAIVNTLLLALAWWSPLGIIGNFAVLVSVALALAWRAERREQPRGSWAGLLVIALSAVATSLWCQDSIRPFEAHGDRVVFKPWVDGFYHAVHVRIFGAAEGSRTIEDFRLSGVPARPYHYGVYLLPGFLKEASGLGSYTVFAGALAPVGVFFSGLAAYALFGSLWGAWSGFSAAAALLLLPDGAEQGLGNPFMSYHWLTQISPSASYGLSLLAVAWLFVLRGSARASRVQLGAGWLCAAVLLVYKLHFVVASSLLLLLVPAVFFGSQGSRSRRVIGGLAACASYGLALTLGQRVPGVPRIVFDGSSAGEILRLIQAFAEPGVLRDFFGRHMGRQFSWTANLGFGVPYVLLTTLGLSVPLLATLLVQLRQRTSHLERLFPLLLIANFLIMFFGLALDFESSTPDELSHRPLMIVYFFTLSWIGGALGSLVQQASRRHRGAAVAGLAAVLAALIVPARLGTGVQAMWAMPRVCPVILPRSLLQVATYIREHGPREDTFQDSQFDRNCAFAALSERRAFVAHPLTRMPFRSEMVESRTNAIDHFMGLRQAKLVVGTARALGFRWFVLQRGDRVDWPSEIVDHPVLEAEPFRLYQF